MNLLTAIKPTTRILGHPGGGTRWLCDQTGETKDDRQIVHEVTTLPRAEKLRSQNRLGFTTWVFDWDWEPTVMLVRNPLLMVFSAAKVLNSKHQQLLTVSQILGGWPYKTETIPPLKAALTSVTTFLARGRHLPWYRVEDIPKPYNRADNTHHPREASWEELFSEDRALTHILQEQQRHFGYEC